MKRAEFSGLPMVRFSLIGYNLPTLVLPAYLPMKHKKIDREKDSPETLIRSLEERLLQAEVRQSAAEVAAFLADDFIEFGSSGRVFNKQQIIESLRQELSTQRSLVEFKASVLAPGVILATYRAVRHSGSNEAVVSSLRSSIWKWIEDRWQMVFHQGTLIRE